MLFPDCGNKAAMIRDELLPYFKDSRLTIQAIEEFVTPENIAKLIHPGDVVILTTHAASPPGHGASVSETDAQLAGAQHRIRVERHRLHAVGRLDQRHLAHHRGVERNHHARVAGREAAHGRGAEAQRQQAVEGRGRASAQQLARTARMLLGGGNPSILLRTFAPC